MTKLKLVMAMALVVAIALPIGADTKQDNPSINDISAKRKKHKHRGYAKVPGSDAGLIRSKKTGAQAWVHPKYASMFQDYIDDLERRDGVEIRYMGGWRRGRCSNGRQHPCGKALDVCQDSRGRTDHLGICHLPPPAEMAAVAKLHGLYEGSRWCDQDYGHAQVDPSGGDCKPKGWTNGVKYVGWLPVITGKLVEVVKDVIKPEAKVKVAEAKDEPQKPAAKKAEPRRRVAYHRVHRYRVARAQYSPAYAFQPAYQVDSNGNYAAYGVSHVSRRHVRYYRYYRYSQSGNVTLSAQRTARLDANGNAVIWMAQR